MRRLRHDNNDEGAVAVLVALLLSGGVLLGMGALVIDVGTLAVEREQLQSGADAAAWAIAATCAKNETAPGCIAPNDLAAGYGRASVNDESAGSYATVAKCQTVCAPVDGPHQCPAVPANLTGGIAQVGTSTLNDDGTDLLPPVLAQALDSDYRGSTVTACSQVVWGVAAEGEVLGFGVGRCRWQDSVGADPSQPAELDVRLDQSKPCSGTPSPPPEFTWLDGPQCTRTVTVGAIVPGSPGLDCGALLAEARDSGRPVAVPVLDRADAGGFHVAGLGGFVVTAVAPPGCPPATTCVTGHFTRMVLPAHATLPGTTDDYGAVVVSRIN
jgi:hypothetical protein